MCEFSFLLYSPYLVVEILGLEYRRLILLRVCWLEVPPSERKAIELWQKEKRERRRNLMDALGPLIRVTWSRGAPERGLTDGIECEVAVKGIHFRNTQMFSTALITNRACSWLSKRRDICGCGFWSWLKHGVFRIAAIL